MDKESLQNADQAETRDSDLATAPEGIRRYVDLIGDEKLEVGSEASAVVEEERVFPVL